MCVGICNAKHEMRGGCVVAAMELRIVGVEVCDVKWVLLSLTMMLC